MICVFCNKKLGPKSFKNSYVIHCEHCKYIYSLISPDHLIRKEIEKEQQTNQPSNDTKKFKINDEVVCIDNNSKMFMKIGKIINKDMYYVKVDFGNTSMWVDKNVVIKN